MGGAEFFSCSLHNKRQTSCAGHTLLREGGPADKGGGATDMGLGTLLTGVGNGGVGVEFLLIFLAFFI